MIQNKFGEIILDEWDLCDLVMQGRDIVNMAEVVVNPDLDLGKLVQSLEDPAQLITWTFPERSDISVPEFDASRQSRWFIPPEYKDLDIARHVLDLCHTQHQLQRVGQELLLYQERGLFDLLRYMKYLVDLMRSNNVIWGVGRGSSVSSYVLYLLEVHRIDSMLYDLDIREFLR
jgi:hypothetical protein